MISKEKLRELIVNNAIIYTTYGGYVSAIKIDRTTDYVEDNWFYEANIVANDTSFIKYTLDILFETEEDADFVLNNHTQKTYKFEPLTWQEFLETKDEKSFAHWFCGDIAIVMCEENNEKGIMHCCNQIEVSLYEDYYSKGRNFPYFMEYGIDTRKEAYYKAVEYARELFLEN